MALISAISIIRTLSIFHLTLSFFLLTSPRTLADQNLVFILGEAMGLRHAQSFSTRSAPTALLAAVVALLGLSDLTAVSLPAEISAYYWGSQAPVRLLFFFLLIGYTYLFKPGGTGGKSGGGYVSGAGDELKNSVVFTWAFVEMMCWFWVYITLRDEKREAVLRLEEKRKMQEDML